jgi:hypothetical protein
MVAFLMPAAGQRQGKDTRSLNNQGKIIPGNCVGLTFGMVEPYLLLMALKKWLATMAFPRGLRCKPSNEKTPPITYWVVKFKPS